MHRNILIRVFFCMLLLHFGLLTGSILAADVTLAWDPVTSSGLTGYKLYYGSSSRSYSNSLNVGNATTYTVSGLSTGTTYFCVTATYSSGVESSYSNEVSKAVSSPAVQVTARKTPVPINVDGLLNETVWGQASSTTFSGGSLSDNQVRVSILWDDSNLYLAYDVQDGQKEATNTSLWADDGAEIYLDMANNKSTSMDSNDHSIISNINNLVSKTGINSRTNINSTGYTMEIGVPWSVVQTAPVLNQKIGLLLANNDRDNGSAVQFDWLNILATGSYSRPNLWGELILGSSLTALPASPLPPPTNVTVK